MRNHIRSFGAACAILGFSAFGPSCGDSTEAEPAHGADASTAVSKAIGPEGGELVSADGRARLDVPAGALTTETTLTIAPAVAAPGGALGPAYDLMPHGTTFETPVFLSMPIDTPPGVDEYAQLAMVIDGQWVPIAGSGLLEDGSAVIGATSHFSTYASHPAKNAPPHKPACGTGGAPAGASGGVPANDPCLCRVTEWLDCCHAAPALNPKYPWTWGGGSPASCYCVNAYNYAVYDCYEQKVGSEGIGCTKCEKDCCKAAGGSPYSYESNPMCGCSTKKADACLKGCAAKNQDKTKCELGAGGTGAAGGAGGAGTGGACASGGTGAGSAGGTGGTGATGGSGGAGGTGGTGTTGGTGGTGGGVCALSLSESFGTNPTGGGKWSYMSTPLPSGKFSDFTIKWDPGAIGSGAGHFRIASAGAADTSMGVALETPLLDASGCGKVTLSFRQVLTGVGDAGSWALQAGFGIVDEANQVNSYDDQALYDFMHTDAPQPAVGNFVIPLAALPANKKFRARWEADHLVPTASVLWAIDDVVIQGTP